MNENRDDTFLARWLNNDLTEEERKEFDASDDYRSYQKIVKASGHIMAEEFDTDSILSRVKSGRQATHVTRKVSHARTVKLWGYGIAATVTLLACFFYFYTRDTLVSTDYGEQMAITLPDGSDMRLNARSEAVYNSQNWQEQRKIELAGEAYFKVASGNTFTVSTSHGDVSVLGTEFNVQSMNGLLTVTCYEGKVKVVTSHSEHILKPGDHFRSLDGSESLSVIKENAPGWASRESRFKSMPVKYVLMALENQFNVDFVYDQLPAEQLYTGSFPHSDVNVALDVVMGALLIEYEIRNDGTVLLKD